LFELDSIEKQKELGTLAPKVSGHLKSDQRPLANARNNVNVIFSAFINHVFLLKKQPQTFST